MALPALERDLAASLACLQWAVNAFTLTLSALILLGGGLGDRFGRRRGYLVGVMWFAAASLLCGLAPSLERLIAGRALQGVGGALVVPGSLALTPVCGALFALGGLTAALGLPRRPTDLPAEPIRHHHWTATCPRMDIPRQQAPNDASVADKPDPKRVDRPHRRSDG